MSTTNFGARPVSRASSAGKLSHGFVSKVNEIETKDPVQSMFGAQIKSERSTLPAYTFSRLGTGRSRDAKPFDGCVYDPMFRGEEHNRHNIPSTPNPGVYKFNVSLGKQTLSTKKLAPAYGFGTCGRWAQRDAIERKRRTPGPGEYVN